MKLYRAGAYGAMVEDDAGKWVHVDDLAERGSGARQDAFYVIEQFTNGKSQGYWNGGSSRSFVPDIDAAMQFCRYVDAQRAIAGWHWQDVKITEHL